MQTNGLFIAGRQHSGNSVLCKIFQNHEHTVGHCDESRWFEDISDVEKLQNPTARVRAVVARLSAHHDGETQNDVEAPLLEWHRVHRDATAYDVFGRGLSLLTQWNGGQWWVLKATSLIFHAGDVLQHMPQVKVIYLVRNPLDLVASNYRRVRRTLDKGNELHYGDWLYTVLVGWRRGLLLASRLQAMYPDRVRIVKYEDMVRRPGNVVPELFQFAGLEYQERFGNVSHLNRSDDARPKIDNETPQKGLNASRVQYYRQVLSPAQQHAARSLIPRRIVSDFYPDLPRQSAVSLTQRCRAQGHKLVCALRLIRRYAKELARQPKQNTRRIWRRVSA